MYDILLIMSFLRQHFLCYFHVVYMLLCQHLCCFVVHNVAVFVLYYNYKLTEITHVVVLLVSFLRKKEPKKE